MKSTMVYKILDSYIRVDLKGRNYKKAKSSMLGYSRKVDDHYINFWFQCSRDGFDEYAGSKFIVQFSIDDVSQIGYSGLKGGRIPKYLTIEELEGIKNIQNRVISQLTKPPKNRYSLQWQPDTISWYLKKFEPITETYINTSDIWFRYKTEADVVNWSTYLNKLILRTLTSFETDY